MKLSENVRKGIFTLVTAVGTPLAYSLTAFAKDDLFDLGEKAGGNLETSLSGLFDAYWFILLGVGLFMLFILKDQTAKGIGLSIAVGTIILKIILKHKQEVENTVDNVISFRGGTHDIVMGVHHYTVDLIGNAHHYTAHLIDATQGLIS